MMMMVPSKPPVYQFQWAPSPSPSPSIAPTASAAGTDSTVLLNQSLPSSSKLPVDFSPPLIAMVVVVATAFLVVTYSRLISRHLIPPILHFLRRWRRRRRRRSSLPSSSGDLDSLPYDSPFEPTDGFHVFSPYGLDETVIKTIPLSLYTTKSNGESRRDCAVCLLEFEDGDYVRTLPVCWHAFHVDCIDVWLRSHANCPLCRAGIFRPESPFIPVMAARIRPSLDELILNRINMEPLIEALTTVSRSSVSEITPCIEDQSPRRINGISEDRNFNGRDFMLKRSYSFGFERSLASERMVMEPATTSPWRYHRKRRYNRGMKSPFFRRRGFFPLSESSVRFSGGSSSRRSKSLASPMFPRSSSSVLAAAGVAAFSSSRLRCGDPEALLSPERFNRR
ncbi:RING-H2 finger protein [Quillaja saponaria]|uniref:RING-type E3 ubiquitin transferase n=1 Tax=Quillaja saponaria TaxID=32244 RepID=A0AAD7KUI0_QUISA|nr:RING-H2 finger protein [Quillaja saponaria]